VRVDLRDENRTLVGTVALNEVGDAVFTPDGHLDEVKAQGLRRFFDKFVVVGEGAKHRVPEDGVLYLEALAFALHGPYLNAIIVPMTLTAEQLALFNKYRPDRYAEVGETKHFAASSFQRICELQLGNWPTIEDVEAEIDLRCGVERLTSDQLALFDKYPPERGASDSQTRFDADSFRQIAELELGDVPSHEAVLAEIDRRSQSAHQALKRAGCASFS
jgi:arginyl-tRNA--protein-N-Asp/Glu arginylyltransferase